MQQPTYEVINAATPLGQPIQAAPGSFAEVLIMASRIVDEESARNEARHAALLRDIQEMSPTVLRLAKKVDLRTVPKSQARASSANARANSNGQGPSMHALVAYRRAGEHPGLKTGLHRGSVIRGVRKLLGAIGGKHSRAKASKPAGDALAASRRRTRFRTLFQSMRLS